MPEEEMISKQTSSERLMNSENLKNVLQHLFSDAIILSTEVKKGAKSSSNIYVNKKYEGKRATVIIWQNNN